jgi:flagellar protein FliO/FliZ
MKKNIHTISSTFGLASSLSADEILAATEVGGRASMLADPGLSGSLLQTTLGLFVVLAVIVAAAWVFKRFSNFKIGVQGQLKIVGGISLGTRERVVLLQVGEKQLVLGVTPGRVQTLHVLDEPLSAQAPAGGDFADRLQEVIAGKAKISTRKIDIDTRVE